MVRELSEVLRQASPQVEIPELVEARILRRAGLVARRTRGTGFRRWAAVAAAAVLVFAFTWILRSPLRSPAPSMERGGPTHSVDLNDDGVTDVLDAYELALRVESGQAVDMAWDVDRNGRIDRRDADSLAMSLVRVDAEIR